MAAKTKLVMTEKQWKDWGFEPVGKEAGGTVWYNPRSRLTVNTKTLKGCAVAYVFDVLIAQAKEEAGSVVRDSIKQALRL